MSEDYPLIAYLKEEILTEQEIEMELISISIK